MLVLILAVYYLTGAPLAYLLVRKSLKRVSSKWTLGDRCLCLLIAFAGSWFILVTAVLMWLGSLVARFVDFDKPAKW